ncbi:MAG: MoxR family ATPase, partial [Deltaproteobacteria bacterium]|nr:MoxR family ATPase [Deltaproteobacteria bacterium]
ILRKNLPFADEEILEYVVEFLQAAHEADERYSVRDGINIARYALKRVISSEQSTSGTKTSATILNYLKEAASLILDEGAINYFNDLLDEMSDEQ